MLRPTRKRPGVGFKLWPPLALGAVRAGCPAHFWVEHSYHPRGVPKPASEPIMLGSHAVEYFPGIGILFIVQYFEPRMKNYC